MANIFDNAAKKLKGSPVILLFFIVAVFMFGIGVVFFIEDTASSYHGIKELETVYGIEPVNYDITYLAASIAPQIAVLGLSYLWLMSDKRNRNSWILLGIVVFQMIDFLSDLQDRSGGQFVTMMQDGVTLNWSPSIAFSSFFTFVYYTIGSEMFISVSVALILALFADAIRQYSKLITDIRRAFQQARGDIRKAHRKPTSHNRTQNSTPSSAALHNRQGQPSQRHRQTGVHHR